MTHAGVFCATGYRFINQVPRLNGCDELGIWVHSDSMEKSTRIGTFWIRRAINVHVGGWPYRLMMISGRYRGLSPACRAHAAGFGTLDEDGLGDCAGR